MHASLQVEFGFRNCCSESDQGECSKVMNEPKESTSISSQKLLEPTTSVAASAILHLTLIATLAFVALPTQNKDSVNTIASNFSPISTEIDPIQIEQETFNNDTSSSSGASQALDKKFLSNVTNAPIDATPDVTQATTLDLANIGQAAGNMSENISSMLKSSEANRGGQGDGGEGSGQGNGDFFGLNLNGTSVVFVVDASSSMNHPFSEPYKTRFGRVKVELVRTIGRMTESEKFFMIFFHDIAVPMPAHRLVSATPANQKTYLTWMAPGQAIGSTEPEAALHMALKLRPEVIYFLTDGRFHFSVVKSVTKANRDRITINTICFGDAEGEKMLKQLAASNGGVYKYVPDTVTEPDSESQPSKISKRAEPDVIEIPK